MTSPPAHPYHRADARHRRPSSPVAGPAQPVAARSRARARRRPLEPAPGRSAAGRGAPVQRTGRGAAGDRAEHPGRPVAPPRARADHRRHAVPAAAAADVVRAGRRRTRARIGAAAAGRLGRAPLGGGGAVPSRAVRHVPRDALVVPDLCGRRRRRAGGRDPERSDSEAVRYTRAGWTTNAGNPGCRSSTARWRRRSCPPTRAARPSCRPSLQGLPARSVPEVAPTPLQAHYINLSVVVLICGAVAISALELGASLGSPLVKVCVALAAPLLVLTTADAVLRIWRAAWAWMPIDRGAACSGSPGWRSAWSGWPRWSRHRSRSSSRDGTAVDADERAVRPRPGRPVHGPADRRQASRPGSPRTSTSARAAAVRSASGRSPARTESGSSVPPAATSPTSTRGSWSPPCRSPKAARSS